MRVLYVEDDADHATLTTRAIRRARPQDEVEVVTRHAHALARLSATDAPVVDLVLTDLRLPDGDGVSLLTWIRQRRLPVAVVVVTASGDEATAVSALKAGADDYVLKHGRYLDRLPLLLEETMERVRQDTALRAGPIFVLSAEPDAARTAELKAHLAAHAAHITLERVSTTAEVLRRLAANSGNAFDALLLDQAPGRIDALEALKEIRQIRRLDVPVIVVTSEGSEEMALQAIKLGAADYVVRHAGYLWRLPAAIESAVHHTRFRREQAALRDSEAQLRQAQKMEAIGRLAGGVAHDFNNLLSVILGHAEIVLGALPAESPLRESTSEVLAAAERAANLTKQLLLFSRRHVIEPQQVELGALSGRLIHLLRRVIGENIEIATDFDPQLLPVHADPHQLEQVLMNLTVNARDAMEGGGRLTVATAMSTVPPGGLPGRPDAMPGTYVRLSVTDTGCGITPDLQARIFDPFFTTKGEGKGTGLGLSTVYGIVKQHGGFVHVESQPGSGATFSVYLPAAAATRSQSEAARPPQGGTVPSPTTGSETILLVDDEDLLRELVREALVDRGYVVLEAADGRDGLQVARAHAGAIDLLVTDMVMPHVSGEELARQLRADRPALKVIFLSGYPESDRDGPADARLTFLPKPFQLQVLLGEVRALLDADTESARRNASAI